MKSASRSFRVVAALAAVLLGLAALAVPSVSAQVPTLPTGGITLTAGAPEPAAAAPGGNGSVIPVAIEYSCGAFSGDITVSFTVVEGNATVTLNQTAITPQSLPDCTPPGDVTDSVSVTIVPDASNLAGSLVVVNVNASGADAFGQEIADDVDVGTTVAPFLDVSFAVPVMRFEIEAGGSATGSLDVTSRSNDEVMAMPSIVGTPAGWTAPSISPLSIPAASVMAPGSTTRNVSFAFIVPETATAGVYHMNLTVFAHAVSDSELETDVQRFPLEVTVVGGTSENESNDSPMPGLVPVVLAALALLALRRRV